LVLFTLKKCIMATYKGGLLSLIKGKIGGTVTYDTKLGYSVTRGIGLRTAPFTTPELENQKGTSLVTMFLKPVMEVIRIGFKNIPPGKPWHPYNYASSVLKLNAVKVNGAVKKIDYAKVVFSIGSIPEPKNPTVKLLDNRLHFGWEADLDTDGTNSNDRVMIVAYFPQILKALYLLNGAKRTEEKEILPLTDFSENTVIETYIFYVSMDGKMLSNTSYTGQVIVDINT